MSARARVYLSVAFAAAVTRPPRSSSGSRSTRAPTSRAVQAQPRFHGNPPVPTGLAAPAGPQIEEAFREWPRGRIDAQMQRLGLAYSPQCGRPVLPRRRADLGRVSRRRGHGARARKAARPQHDLAGKGRRPPAPQLLRAHERTALPALPAAQAQRAARTRLAAAGRRSPGVRRGALPHGSSARPLRRRGPGRRRRRSSSTEDNLVPAFSHLGPLTARFPRSQSVHYYLGYLLAWTHQSASAIRQFEQTVKLGPTTVLGRASTRLLEAIAREETRRAAAPGEVQAQRGASVRAACNSCASARGCGPRGGASIRGRQATRERRSVGGWERGGELLRARARRGRASPRRAPSG